MITCIFEVDDNYFAEHVDGYFSNSNLKMLFWLRKILTEERSLFPPKLRYNDTLHFGRFFYRSMFYSSTHQTINWFCLIVTLFIPHRLGSPTVTVFYCFLLRFGDPKKESARHREKKKRVKVQMKQRVSD